MQWVNKAVIPNKPVNEKTTPKIRKIIPIKLTCIEYFWNVESKNHIGPKKKSITINRFFHGSLQLIITLALLFDKLWTGTVTNETVAELLVCFVFFTAQCTLVQSAVLRLYVVRLSVTLVDCDHIGWKYWKLIASTISPTSSLFVAKRQSTYS